MLGATLAPTSACLFFPLTLVYSHLVRMKGRYSGSFGLEIPCPATFSAGTFLKAPGWGLGSPELGYCLSSSQEPVGSIRPFWHSLPTRPAPQDASSREGPAGPMPAWPLLAVARHLGVGVCVVCMGSLPLDT